MAGIGESLLLQPQDLLLQRPGLLSQSRAGWPPGGLGGGGEATETYTQDIKGAYIYMQTLRYYNNYIQPYDKLTFLFLMP